MPAAAASARPCTPPRLRPEGGPWRPQWSGPPEDPECPRGRCPAAPRSPPRPREAGGSAQSAL
eukprot:10394189-Lingulodinium_polyedra.AAC.1